MRIPGWLIYAILSTSFWGIFGFLSKVGAERFGPADMQILFTIGTVPLTIVAWIRERGNIGRNRTGVLCGIGIGVLSTVAFLFYVRAMATGKAVIIGPITALYPLPTIVLAIVLLKEKLNRVQLAGVVLAIASILILAG